MIEQLRVYRSLKFLSYERLLAGRQSWMKVVKKTLLKENEEVEKLKSLAKLMQTLPIELQDEIFEAVYQSLLPQQLKPHYHITGNMKPFGIAKTSLETTIQSLIKLENSFRLSDLLLAVKPSILRGSRISTLHSAVLNGDEPVINAVLPRDIHSRFNPDQTDSHGNTPLHLAALYGKYNSTKLLINGGASLNIQDQKGKTALHLAAEMNEQKVLALLLDRGAEVNATDRSGKTALHLAAGAGRLETVQCLLQYGADTTITDLLGNNTLHTAASCNVNQDVIELLIQHNVDIQAMNHAKEMPLQVATRLQYHENIASLKRGKR